jgi:predicted Fe-Mo cluster-binding NifX family protein
MNGNFQTRVAVATSTGANVDMHFGHCGTFYVYELNGEGVTGVSNTGGEGVTGEGGGASDTFGKANNTGRAFTFVETRSVEKCCQGGLHAPGRFEAVAENLADCQVILCEQIGPGALRAMEAAGFVVFEVDAPVAGALEALTSKLHVLGL